MGVVKTIKLANSMRALRQGHCPRNAFGDAVEDVTFELQT